MKVSFNCDAQLLIVDGATYDDTEFRTDGLTVFNISNVMPDNVLLPYTAPLCDIVSDYQGLLYIHKSGDDLIIDSINLGSISFDNIETLVHFIVPVA